MFTYLYYCEVLEKGLLPDIARNTMEYLEKEKIDFIEPDMWPPNSPDLNPVDHAVCDALQQRVYYGRKFETVEELKQTIVTE